MALSSGKSTRTASGVKKSRTKKASGKKKVASALLEIEKGQRDRAGDDITAAVLDRLHETVLSRRGTDPSLSHSARLLSRGRKKIAQKFGEEAVECLIEAVAGSANELVSESADVLYHLIVLWVDAGIAPQEIWRELQRREAMSGIAEKASRGEKPA
ncbi:Phosphoribosyl-ATP pyrophosphatase [Acetobacteraceae bacterium EV16G]|uniref:Phosphoribosyl-ATP pyrophosphatase n=1 Tax=Sorlinia euscelidii TaxID=3081148 RepID=A0ABU7U2S7_9PROT